MCAGLDLKCKEHISNCDAKWQNCLNHKGRGGRWVGDVFEFILHPLFSVSLQKLNSPVLSVNGEGFIPMLTKLDNCIEYVSAHVSFFFVVDILAALLADFILPPQEITLSLWNSDADAVKPMGI